MIQPSASSPSPRNATVAPSHARYWVLFFAITLAIITYVDRVCISKSADLIQKDLGFGKQEMGMVFSAFTLSYALFEIPAGWLGDRNGPRQVLMKVVLMWSFFTAATGWAWNLASMIVCRFLFGAGEAGCFPNLTKIFTTWLPADERVRAQGILWLAARWGGAFTPLLVVWVLTFLTWQQSFMLFGALGVIWAGCFYAWFRDNPRDHPAVNSGELALLSGAEGNASGHGDVPWGKLVRSGSVWLLWLQYFCMSYGWYFYITWLPTYIKEVHGAESVKGALLAVLPLFCGGIGCIFSGLIAARLSAALADTGKARRLIACIGLIGAAAMLVVATRLPTPAAAMLALGLASFCNDLAMPSGWGACMDIGGRYAGSVSGSMNMMGNLGGAVGGVVVPQVLLLTNNSWTMTFYVSAAVYIVGAISWVFIDPVTPIESRGQASPRPA
jgi:ACS family glucarate transporter-like MFS transporter